MHSTARHSFAQHGAAQRAPSKTRLARALTGVADVQEAAGLAALAVHSQGVAHGRLARGKRVCRGGITACGALHAAAEQQLWLEAPQSRPQSPSLAG